ncbi:glycosyltransferase family 2 protein [Clostridium cadaveris]|uniref:Glycosyl transferase family 2 n=1 Tax=Clostridium cadaveris TaxID=1529 RepID=A0A1I2JGN2_9CLOT|nr:glycosyltransferase family 2 protein [Clostridium cadaveris]MDM8311836.1 glycosyltransferase family 2 protein [Clostridium cadaveris]MDY4950349.1 glycosyltransferase family 2 protein [Clostridium cadaveris]NME65858.1 glycosyltransferase family 2 protein [Clostridium cadaveris]NWK11845.1 glycosyltransferase family 2 protein [Clostridium cadaveris]PWL53040.1 MAG: glycosyl transferase family 2 [Clostridium cadaveris]
MIPFKTVMQFMLSIFTNVVLIITMYYLILSLFGLVKKRDNNTFEPQKSFALVVAAHNEEAVIEGIINSLLKLDYPKELYDIYVIADNCSDATAAISKNAGAIVYERFNKDLRGKGYALEWMFKKLFSLEKQYDSIVILDADNLVSRNFLKAMNNKLCEGYKVVQGYLDSKNPKDTWITACYSISFWSTNRMFQLARNNLGLSSQLGGTGFCMDTQILKELGWGATCLTEDLEFTCKLVLNGYKVGWAHDAVIYDEKPLSLAQSWAQRRRWMQGFADVSSRYFFKLMKMSIKERSFTKFDCALYSIQPIVTILLGISTILNCIQQLFAAPETITKVINMMNTTGITIAAACLLLAMVLQFLYTPFILFLEKKLDLKIILYYLIYPVYLITWLPICIQGVMNKENKEWSHTKHTRSVNIEELEKVN